MKQTKSSVTDLPVDLDLVLVIESWMYKNPQTLNQEHLNEDLQYLLTMTEQLNSVKPCGCQKSFHEESTGKTVENKHILNFHKSVTEIVAKEI